MEIDRDLTCMEGTYSEDALAVYGQAGSNKKSWLIPALPYQEVVIPIICTPSSGLLLVVWNNCRATLTGRVERIQNDALRMILRKPPPTSSELLQQILGWTTLKARRHNAMLCQVHHCCTNQAPPYLCSKFTPNSDLNYIRTRGSNKLHLHAKTTDQFYHSSFEFQGAMHFNNLLENIRVRDVNNLRLLYLSITIIFHSSIFCCCCFFVFCCCCCFLFSLVALPLCISN